MSAHCRDPIDRLVEKIDFTDDGCWLWTANVTVHGYGRFYEGGSYGRSLMAHRVVWEFFVGPIPEGLTLDHLCHGSDENCTSGDSCVHRRCVNPDHLEVVTMRENVLRGRTPAAMNAAKTHCPQGHPLSGENVYLYEQGWRACRACIRDRSRIRMRGVRERKRQERAAA